MTERIIEQVCQYLQVQVGALYLADGNCLVRAGSYAYSNKQTNSFFEFGEGLIGQVAVEKAPMILTDVPDDYITIKSALGQTPPKCIMIYPFLYDQQVIGVIELGSLGELGQMQLDFLQRALGTIAIVINTAQARERIDELLVETQRQAEELQAQGEALRTSNEELETQTESLRASEVKLIEKQAELEATNTQLEEQTAALEERGAELRKKQDILDRQNQELKVIQTELEIQADELALASKYKSEFLANMSHELRTPLNSLLILARMLKDNETGNLTDDQIESAQIIYDGGHDLLNLINEILDLAKVESGKMSFKIEAMPLNELKTMTEAQFAHVAQEKGA